MRNLTLGLFWSMAVFMWACGGSGDAGDRSSTAAPESIELELKEHYAVGEQAAQQVLLAYATKDVDLLKEYASSMMRMALDEAAMERPRFAEALYGWDGVIREIRYDTDVVTFETVYYAYGHFADHERGDINVVVLESKNQEDWMITMNPLRQMSLVDFQGKNPTIP